MLFRLYNFFLRLVSKEKLLLSLLFFPLVIFAQKDSISTKTRKADYYIDYDQRRIDLLDRTLNSRVSIGDSSANVNATLVYFKLVDSIQRLIEKPGLNEGQRKSFREYLFLQLQKVNSKTVYDVRRFDYTFRFILGEINAVFKNRLFNYLTSNVQQGLDNIELFKYERCADSFLIFSARYRPDLVFGNSTS